jgi:hypothetical protein
MDPRITRKGKEKNKQKDKSAYKYNNKRVRQYEVQHNKKEVVVHTREIKPKL